MKIIVSLLITTLFFACNNSNDKKIEKAKNYRLKEIEGVYTEVFDSTNVNPNRYTDNNIIYTENNEFTYNFEHTKTDGTKYYFKVDETRAERKNQWKFVNADSVGHNTIKQVKITVLYGLKPFIEHIPDYNQTILKYNYPTENDELPFNAISGAIENEKNVWIHPPRDRYFRVLELDPFPFIKTPYKVGNTWGWQLNIGNQWGDKRWKVWDGGIQNKYSYKITDMQVIETKLGKLNCFVVKSTAISRIGETKLTAYFNEKYGFMKLNYTNIDGSKTDLELVKFVAGKSKKVKK